MKNEAISNTLYLIQEQEEQSTSQLQEDSIITSVDRLLSQAIFMHASDIHLEPSEALLRVRFRIDGILYDQKSFSLSERAFIIARLKILASLDIAERRLAQDGKVRLQCNNAFYDLRISTFPSVYGEKLVVRILDNKSSLLHLSALGFSKPLHEKMQQCMKQQQGFFLVTGATGSGKTTTLYSLLCSINDSTRNIVTMEDPVEFTLEGITQSQVNLKTGFSFENGLRSLLRQDPDVIMIGEIRDRVTAQIALEAALTGHLVVSTLHTSRASAAVARLLEMGIEPFFINATISGILAQRLVRRLCSYCKKSRVTKQEEHEFFESRSFISPKVMYEAQGCARCFDMGCRGREAVGEFLVLSSEVRECILRKASIQEIEECAQKSGMKSIQENLFEKCSDGIISFDEYLKHLELL